MQLTENKNVQDFINRILSEVRFKEAHSEIRQEYLSHIEDAVNTGMSYGLSREAATQEALNRMGKTDKIGADLDKVHKPKIDLTLVLSCLGLCVLGLVSLNSFNLSVLQGVWTVLGVLACGALAFAKPSTILKISPFAYPLAIVLIAISYLGGVSFDGQPYLSLFGLNIKIVDFSAVLFFIAVTGMMFTLPKKAAYFNSMIVILATLPLIYFSAIHAFASSALYFITIVSIFISSRFNTKFLTGFTLAGISLVALSAKNAFVSLESLTSIQKTEAHTDFIFNNMMETSPYLGMVAAILFGLLMVRIVTVSKDLKNPFSKSITAGTAAMLIGGTLWGILSNIGFAPMPTAGLNIPFLSYGGSLLVANLTLIGIVIGANRRKMLSLFS